MFNNHDLASNIQRNTLRYIRYFEEQADELMPIPSEHVFETDIRDTLEVLRLFLSSNRLILF